MHHPDALPQGNVRRWPACHGCPVGRFRHLEVVHAGSADQHSDADVKPRLCRCNRLAVGVGWGQKKIPGLLGPPMTALRAGSKFVCLSAIADFVVKVADEDGENRRSAGFERTVSARTCAIRTRSMLRNLQRRQHRLRRFERCLVRLGAKPASEVRP
jgi:hypothetical protein